MDKYGRPTTVEEIKQSDKEMLVPQDVSGVLGCNHYYINLQARDDKEKLGFPVCMMRTRIYIPRIGFINWAEHNKNEMIGNFNPYEITNIVGSELKKQLQVLTPYIANSIYSPTITSVNNRLVALYSERVTA